MLGGRLSCGQSLIHPDGLTLAALAFLVASVAVGAFLAVSRPVNGGEKMAVR
jgi:hypothetical protein